MIALTVILQVAAAAFSLTFDEAPSDKVEVAPYYEGVAADGRVTGVSGNAALFDGISSRIVIPAEGLKLPENTFTIDLWVCPVAFPKSPCPLVSKKPDNVPGGFDMWLDALGKVHFKVACAGEWLETAAEEGLELREWSRITCLFRAGNSIRLAIDGKEVAFARMELPYLKTDGYDMWIGRTQVRTPSFFENQNIPIYSSFDGAIDEITISEGRDAYNDILKQKSEKPEAPQFERRILPSGPEGTLAFGSWYIPLKYYKAWDEQWRGETPDIVVGFGEQFPFRVVFWRGISYAPCFVTEKGNWMCNEFIERSKVTGWGCPESMSDKHADFSSIKILENTPARTVVLWRNAPVGVNQKFPYQSEETQWGDWSEERYIFYPDGVGVRKMDVWTSVPDEWSEWCQSLQVLHPDQRPEDVLDAEKIMSVAAMDGSHQTFGWNFDSKAIQHEPSIPGANIQVTYINSKWNPFLILDDRAGLNDCGTDGPEIHRYAGRWSKFSDFPWRNHWPVAQDYVIGRYACVADAPSHTYTATQYCAPYYAGNGKFTKLMLCGCTDKDAEDLLPLAKSWLRAPEIFCGGKKLEFDLTERAYRFNAAGGSEAISLEINASPENPCNGVCLLIDGWKENVSAVSLNGRSLAASEYKWGVNKRYDGSTLVVWLDIKAESKAGLTLLSSVGGL